ncbi:MAG: FAD:protein FMN transferase [Prevotellaceae bacterium]|nr:FAD:protein FMN transferase [Prevotellaceae bacterium]
MNFVLSTVLSNTTSLPVRYLGIKNYLVEVGGETVVKGKNRLGKNWRIGIDKPFDGNLIPGQSLQAIVNVSDKALATSGDYRRYYIEDGVKYSHTIDPKTGYSAKRNVLSVTVIAADCMTADALATAFMVMGLEKLRSSYSIILISKCFCSTPIRRM